MKRKEDPAQEKAQIARRETHLWLELLSRGIGSMLANDSHCRYPEETRSIIGRVNSELLIAVHAAEAADVAYEQYWKRRRIRRHVLQTPKKTKKVA